jgi:beta-lactamase regulating signal transducer with metallopeptidase domain
MIDFLIKSTISLTVLLGFYHLVLEHEKMHKFNRFYLLFSIVISFMIPFITFEIIKVIPVAAITEPFYMPFPMSNETIPVTETIDYTPIILWSLYGVTTLFLTIRFGKNIWKLTSKSTSNPIVKYKNAQLVLVDEKTLPHTFLNSIFINFDDYNQRNIEDELYTHELVHVTQKHTLDILFIELLKTIFWFNPLFYFYKKAIQLNHEFLADEKVVKSYNDVPFYQSLLLQKANGNPTIYLASNLNYLVTKKRLIMMTKNTSKKIALIKKIAILPVMAGLIFFICIKVVAQEKINPKATKAVPLRGMELSSSETDDKRRDAYYSGVRIMLKDYRYGIEINEMYEDLTLEQKRMYLNWIPSPIKENKITKALLTKLAITNKNAVWIDERVITNSELKKFQSSDFKHYTVSFVHKNARSKRFPQNYQYHLYTKDYFDKNLKNLHLKFSNDTLKLGVSNFHKPKNVKTLKKIKADTLLWYSHGKKEDNLYLQDTVKNKKLTKPSLGNEIYDVSGLTEKPEFELGLEAFYKYVGANFKIPEEVTKNKLKGRVFASFIVEKDGSLSNLKVLRDMGYGTGEEAVRVLKESPKWKPGKIDGKAVRTNYSLPISIAAE